MTEEKFHDTGLGYNYLDMTLKVQATKEKTDKLTSSRLKTFVVSKNNMIRSGTFRVDFFRTDWFDLLADPQPYPFKGRTTMLHGKE